MSNLGAASDVLSPCGFARAGVDARLVYRQNGFAQNLKDPTVDAVYVAGESAELPSSHAHCMHQLSASCHGLLVPDTAMHGFAFELSGAWGLWGDEAWNDTVVLCMQRI